MQSIRRELYRKKSMVYINNRYLNHVKYLGLNLELNLSFLHKPYNIRDIMFVIQLKKNSHISNSIYSNLNISSEANFK